MRFDNQRLIQDSSFIQICDQQGQVSRGKFQKKNEKEAAAHGGSCTFADVYTKRQ